MNKSHVAVGAIALVVIATAIAYLQNFDAGKIACEDIPQARAELQAQHKAGVDASVALYREERQIAEERLSQCLSAKPVDPCAAEQAARDQAYKDFFAIPSPAQDAPYEEFKDYYQKRDVAYEAYKVAKAALDQCRAANPPRPEVPYEQSDTKACFDEYDAAEKTAQDTFTQNTQTMRSALNAALAALDAREQACNPPQGSDQFTAVPGTGVNEEDYSNNIKNCRPIDSDFDAELMRLRQRAADIGQEIQSIDTTLENAEKKRSSVRVDLSNVDTYIPPESSKTQFEGAMNALRGQRKVSLEFALDYYEKLIERKEAEKADLQDELLDIEAQITARLSEIQAENADRAQKYPTNLHLGQHEKCNYYHCHGMLCGIPDPDPEECGQGTTHEGDKDCKEFFEAYLKAAGS